MPIDGRGIKTTSSHSVGLLRVLVDGATLTDQLVDPPVYV